MYWNRLPIGAGDLGKCPVFLNGSPVAGGLGNHKVQRGSRATRNVHGTEFRYDQILPLVEGTCQERCEEVD